MRPCIASPMPGVWAKYRKRQGPDAAEFCIENHSFPMVIRRPLTLPVEPLPGY